MNRLRGILLAGLILALVTVPVSASTDTIAAPGQWAANDTGIVWINTQVGYLIYTNGSPIAADLVWSKTIDGGTNWTAPATIQADNPTTTCETAPGLSVWYDQWTKGDSGTRIHIAWHHNSDTAGSCSNAGSNDNISYNYLDTSNDVLGSTVVTVLTSYTGQCLTGGNPCNVSLTKAVNGDLYIQANLTTSSAQKRILKSDDSGVTWSSVSIGPAGVAFVGALTPAAPNIHHNIGSNDIWAITHDAKVLFYDGAINFWSEVKDFSGSIGAPCSTNAGAANKCFTRANDPTVLTPTATVDGDDVPYAFYGIANGTTVSRDFYVIRQDLGAGAGTPIDAGITLQTPVFTAMASVLNIGLTYDDNTDILYAFYQDFNVDEIYYKTSSNYGATWSAQTRFDDSLNAKGDILTSPILTRSGARVMPIWEEAPDLVTNVGNAITTSSTIVIDDQDFDNKIVRFVNGLGLRGSSGKMAFTAMGGALLAIMLLFRAPVIVFLSLEMLWFGAMAAIEFVTPGLFLTLLTIFGVLMIFAILAKLHESQGGDL